MDILGTVDLPNLDDENFFSVAYAKFWAKLFLTHSLNARVQSILYW